MNCTPIGRPSSVQWSGTDIAGWPVTLTIAVNGVKCHCRAKAMRVPAGLVPRPADRAPAAARASASRRRRRRPRTRRLAAQRLQPHDRDGSLRARGRARLLGEHPVDRLEQREVVDAGRSPARSARSRVNCSIGVVAPPRRRRLDDVVSELARAARPPRATRRAARRDRPARRSAASSSRRCAAGPARRRPRRGTAAPAAGAT